MTVKRINLSTTYSVDGDYCCQSCGVDDVVIFSVLSDGLYQYLCTSHLTDWIMMGKIHVGDPYCASCAEVVRSDAVYCGNCTGNTKCQACEANFAVICEDCHDEGINDRRNACDLCGDDGMTVACADCAPNEFDLVTPDETTCGNRWCTEQRDLRCYEHARDDWDLVDSEHEHECEECGEPYGIRILCEDHVFRCDGCGELMSCTSSDCIYGKDTTQPTTAAAPQPVSTDDGQNISFDDGIVIRFGH